ncbi:hypothetical protein SAMN04489740_0851 [Arthrobacter alpinus]|uniref:Uncharacterized protein n=1 Tax=Arthrobacter alpinus TaxID=656366 RepID=A0A1H5GW31_9MICC|nr:hypothetical protein SAMN04489740_0851 [Arthrobacter alpinus]
MLTVMAVRQDAKWHSAGSYGWAVIISRVEVLCIEFVASLVCSHAPESRARKDRLSSPTIHTPRGCFFMPERGSHAITFEGHGMTGNWPPGLAQEG